MQIILADDSSIIKAFENLSWPGCIAIGVIALAIAWIITTAFKRM